MAQPEELERYYAEEFVCKRLGIPYDKPFPEDEIYYGHHIPDKYRIIDILIEKLRGTRRREKLLADLVKMRGQWFDMARKDIANLENKVEDLEAFIDLLETDLDEYEELGGYQFLASLAAEHVPIRERIMYMVEGFWEKLGEYFH